MPRVVIVGSAPPRSTLAERYVSGELERGDVVDDFAIVDSALSRECKRALVRAWRRNVDGQLSQAGDVVGNLTRVLDTADDIVVNVTARQMTGIRNAVNPAVAAEAHVRAAAELSTATHGDSTL